MLRLLSVDQWEKDKDAPNCRCCGRKFGLRTRHHHCRLDGLNFCDRCSLLVNLPAAGEHRVCLICSEFVRLVKAQWRDGVPPPPAMRFGDGTVVDASGVSPAGAAAIPFSDVLSFNKEEIGRHVLSFSARSAPDVRFPTYFAQSIYRLMGMHIKLARGASSAPVAVLANGRKQAAAPAMVDSGAGEPNGRVNPVSPRSAALRVKSLIVVPKTDEFPRTPAQKALSVCWSYSTSAAFPAKSMMRRRSPELAQYPPVRQFAAHDGKQAEAIVLMVESIRQPDAKFFRQFVKQRDDDEDEDDDDKDNDGQLDLFAAFLLLSPASPVAPPTLNQTLEKAQGRLPVFLYFVNDLSELRGDVLPALVRETSPFKDNWSARRLRPIAAATPGELHPPTKLEPPKFAAFFMSPPFTQLQSWGDSPPPAAQPKEPTEAAAPLSSSAAILSAKNTGLLTDYY